MEPVRLLHFADLHLGVESGGRTNPSSGLNQRVHDVCDRLDEVCATVERESVHAVLFAGDAFMNPRPSPTLQKLFAERIRRLVDGGAAVFLLVGNHDLPRMAGIAHPHSIYTALEVDGVVVGDRAQVYRLPLAGGVTLQVAALPHFSKGQVASQLPDDVNAAAYIEERVAERVRALGVQTDARQPAVFAGHCHVNQADVGDAHGLFNVSDVEVSLSTLTSGQPFPSYALGHVHKRQVLRDDPFVAYSGSLERVDFGEGDRVDVSADGRVAIREADPKGFFRFDLIQDGDRWRLAAPPEFREVAARRFVTIRVEELDVDDPVTELERRIGAVRTQIDLTDTFVQIRGSIAESERSRVTSATARELVPEAYDTRLSLDVVEGSLVRDPGFATRMTEMEALERFVDSKPDWADDRDELLRLGRDLAAEVLS